MAHAVISSSVRFSSRCDPLSFRRQGRRRALRRGGRCKIASSVLSVGPEGCRAGTLAPGLAESKVSVPAEQTLANALQTLRP